LGPIIWPLFFVTSIMDFIDHIRLTVESGKGGPGSVSFRREKYIPRGGPDGGDGGKGGDIIIETAKNLNSLLHYQNKRQFKAKNGQGGGPQNMTGASGEDTVLKVPPGTLVKDEDDNVIADLKGHPERIVLLRGGKGGKGNWYFRNSVNQAPQYAQPGLEGEAKEIQLELKLLADVGLLGFPNVGKSTLISRVSAAKPKIANYPFTTLVPNLGVVKLWGNDSFVIADIPGLIPDAHKGVGLGIQFLRHIERTSLFVHMVDVSPETARSPMDDYKKINNELAMYDQEALNRLGSKLTERKQIIVLNKCDTQAPEKLEEIVFEFETQGVKVLQMSAATGQGTQDLINIIGEELSNEQ
jgi:GTP-binding protein